MYQNHEMAEKSKNIVQILQSLMFRLYFSRYQNFGATLTRVNHLVLRRPRHSYVSVQEILINLSSTHLGLTCVLHVIRLIGGPKHPGSPMFPLIHKRERRAMPGTAVVQDTEQRLNTPQLAQNSHN